MNVIFKYRLIDEAARGLSSWLLYYPEVINAPKDGYEKYLLSALGTDYPTDHPEWCDQVLANIEKLERGEIESTEWDGQGFQHQMTRDKVTLVHTIFDECPEWPIWSCTLAQYKAALQGYREFLDMPKSIESELIVELPDGDS